MRVSEPILLLTRPLDASQRFATLMQDRLRRAVRICISPLLDIVPVSQAVDFGNANGLVFTSANGVVALSRLTQDRTLPAYCVGAATCEAARTHGWVATVSGQDAQSLIAGVSASGIKGSLMHIRGVHSRGDVAKNLTEVGVPTSETIVYDQVELELNQDAKTLLSGSDAVFVPLFSPRTAASFQRQVSGTAPVYPVALSQAVADELRDKCPVAVTPDAQALALETEKLINKVCPLEAR